MYLLSLQACLHLPYYPPGCTKLRIVHFLISEALQNCLNIFEVSNKFKYVPK